MPCIQPTSITYPYYPPHKKQISVVLPCYSQDVTLLICTKFIAHTRRSITQANISTTIGYCYICEPENFDHGSAAGTFWLRLAMMNGQILEISHSFTLI